MIGKLLRGGAALLMYFCLATVIAEVVLLVNFVSGGKINRDKLIRMFAVAHGIDEELYGGAGRDRDDVGLEQVSPEEILAARTKRFLALQRREQALQDGLAQLDFAEQKLAKDWGQFRRVRETWEKELQEEEQGAVAAGRADLVTKLTTIKPDEAKVVLSEMLKNNEEDEVVALVKAMSTSKAGKIISEFLPDEIEEIYPVLQKIGQGFPEAGRAQKTLGELQQTAGQP